MDNRKISICIPTWNRFELTINSFSKILNDDRVSEIIIVDDCSTDDSYVKLTNFSNGKDKIKLYRNDVNLDCYKNKQRAISLAQNEWCILFDSDNVLTTDYINTIFNIQEWKKDVVYLPVFAKPNFDYREFSDLLVTKNNINQYLSEAMFLTALNTCNFFINKITYLDSWDPKVDPITADSIYLNYCLLAKGYSLYFVPGLEYDHLVHDGSHYRNNLHRTGTFYDNVIELIKNFNNKNNLDNSNVATTVLQGRIGNNFYQIAMLLAYCKKHNILYQIPTTGVNCDNNKTYFNLLSTGHSDKFNDFYEPRPNDIPYLMDIPKLSNPRFIGYWQCFDYIDNYREYILNIFNIEYKKIDNTVSIHVRRGDFLELQNKHPYVGMDYYSEAIKYFNKLNYFKFIVFSDDINWCKTQFNSYNFMDCEFMFSEDRSELEDLTYMSQCEHNIICMSTFSFVAGWLNRNPNKIVLCPDDKYVFKGAHTNMIPKYFTKLN